MEPKKYSNLRKSTWNCQSTWMTNWTRKRRMFSSTWKCISKMNDYYTALLWYISCLTHQYLWAIKYIRKLSFWSLIYYYFQNEYTILGGGRKFCNWRAGFPQTIQWPKTAYGGGDASVDKEGNHPRGCLRRYPWRVIPYVWCSHFTNKN